MKKTLAALSLSALMLAACSKPAPQQEQAQNDQPRPSPVVPSSDQASAHPSTTVNATSGNAAAITNWVGKYQGLMPCADCEGIETTLQLHANQTYELEQKYQGKGKDNEFKVTGSFTIDSANPAIIQLDQAGDHRQYQKEGNNLHALTSEGKKVAGALASSYILKQE